MSEYFVARGTYTNLKGEDYFHLVCPGPGEPPYVLVEGVMEYFRLVWQNVHLYRVEDDYTLSLVVLSHVDIRILWKFKLWKNIIHYII
jgi:hypothetical protein